MSPPVSFMSEGRLVGSAIAAARPEPRMLAQALSKSPDPALAILAGLHGGPDCRPVLAGLLDREGLLGRAAAWSLGRLGGEAEALLAIIDGKLDVREQGYLTLAILAATGKASAGLAPAMLTQVESELARSKAKRTGLAEHACRVLAILGSPGTSDLIGRVLLEDPLCDRFALQRMRKELASGNGVDQESRDLHAAPWTAFFADQLASEAAPPSAKTADPEPAEEPVADAELQSDEGEPPPVTAQPIDWQAFLKSPQAASLDPNVRSLAAQVGPILEQLAVRAIGAALIDLNRQELAGLLLQVLPQAIPPQAVQAALSPQAINAYTALAKWLSATDPAGRGSELLAGIRLVRQQLTESIRSRGILGGPDYSDPDQPPAKTGNLRK